jgi:trimeric autotransporter adhesin
MKHLTLVILAFSMLMHNSYSQAPQFIKYQAIARNSVGQIIQNQVVSLKINIYQGSLNGSLVYSETQIDTVKLFGLITISIGAGNPLAGMFSAIDWASGPYFLETAMDPSGGTNYTVVGKSQLLSVPYALFAGKSAGADSKFEVQAHNQISSDSALFVVRDRNGNPVFSVYENGVEVAYDESVKGAKGGFVVGGRSAAKGPLQNILTVSADSVRIYIDTAQMKGAKGGFVVGGRTSAKGEDIEYFKITGNITTDTSLTNTFTILKNGNVGINNTNPSEALDIGIGWATVAPGYGWLTPSDARYKKNIISISNTLAKVMQLRPVRYDLITGEPASDDFPHHIGFIAQELEQLFPELVVTNDKGYKSITYDQLTPILVEATKEQQSEIEALKIENEMLRSRLDSLSTMDARLKLLEKKIH